MCAGAGRELDLQARRPSSSCLPSSLSTPLGLTTLLPWVTRQCRHSESCNELCRKFLISEDLIVFKINMGGF